MNFELDSYLTSEEAAKYLDVSRAAVYAYISEDRLHTVKKGKILFFYREELDEFKSSQWFCVDRHQRPGRPVSPLS